MASSGLLLGDRYQLADRIATGGMGEVWRATDLVLGRAVAVKLLRSGCGGSQEDRARFRAEARHAGSLSHPGIARVYDYREADPLHPPYLVMELIDGPSLARLLDEGPVDPARTMGLIAQAAAALQAAHAAGLVHRDIKPGNLLITQDGDVKVTDFGIAHAAGSASITGPGALIGTPAYLAPERAAGAPATPTADLYALGIVAYQCLTGRLPFDGAPLAVALAHLERPVPPLPPHVPAAVAALVADLTAKDPRARPASAREVAERAQRLHDALTRGVADPPDVPTLTWASTPTRRTRTRLTSVLVLAMITAIGAVVLAGWVTGGRYGQQFIAPSIAQRSGPASSHGTHHAPARRAHDGTGAGTADQVGQSAVTRKRPTPSVKPTPTPDRTPTRTPTPSVTPSPTGTSSPTGTPTQAGTPSQTGTPSPTGTPTQTGTGTGSPTPVPSDSLSPVPALAFQALQSVTG